MHAFTVWPPSTQLISLVLLLQLGRTRSSTSTADSSTGWCFQTHFKNIIYCSQIGHLPQIGMKIKNNWNYHLVAAWILLTIVFFDVIILSFVFFRAPDRGCHIDLRVRTRMNPEPQNGAKQPFSRTWYSLSWNSPSFLATRLRGYEWKLLPKTIMIKLLNEGFSRQLTTLTPSKKRLMEGCKNFKKKGWPFSHNKPTFFFRNHREAQQNHQGSHSFLNGWERIAQQNTKGQI